MQNYQSRTILRLGFITLLLLFLAVVGVWFKTVSSNSTNLNHMIMEQDARQLIFKMRDASYQRSLSLHRMATMTDPFARDDEFLKFKQYAVQFILARQQLMERYLHKKELHIWIQIRPLIVQSETIQNQIVDLIMDEKQQEAYQLLENKFLPTHFAVIQLLTWMLDFARSEMDKELKHASDRIRKHYVLIFSLLFTALVIGSMITKYVTRRTEEAEHYLLTQNQQIRALYEASSKAGQSAEQHASNILQLGCRFLEMDAGVIANIGTDNNYVNILSKYCNSDRAEFTESLSLEQVFINDTLITQDPIAVQEIASSDYKNDCIFLKQAVAFISMPIIAHEKVFGLITFISWSHKADAFTCTNKELIRLIANWVGFTIERQHAQQQLQHAKDAAETANRTKSAFLANMSHELRTPLHTIIGYSDILTEEATQNSHYQYTEDLEIIHASGQQLLSLISNIFDLTKLEVGSIELEWEYCEARHLIEETPLSIKPLLDKNRNSFKLNYLNDIGIIYTDIAKLRQIVLNLLNNACKFTHTGEITVTVWREKGSDDDWLYFEVKDTGIGMSKKQISNLFKMFSQASPETGKYYGGSGLGLAISKKLCESMGGSIVVESEPDKGSVFTVCLPCKAQLNEMGAQAIA